ncbi:Crp/Fnr family transcriptional regulator [Roseivirga sp. E12]|uniref:Crp/Fnr family transcriptional regulator n=1 Tax=Roseivirga sp. E12 TaxID=2819237 RepID=UPI001ABC563D|nr:Crp/Fnr family transcriptional regulator [Roseivirga sp. E12]MBO3699350.1 Crp/Fnr family transcriptional regulator [Roseivirga sp. E12]
MDDKIAGLKASFEKYITLTDEEFEVLSASWKPFSFDKQEAITGFGQTERYFYYVHKGLMRGFFLKNGVEYNIGFSYDGEYSGVYDSFISQQPSTWTLETISPSVGLKIEYKKLMQQLDEHRSMERWLRLFYQQVLVGFGIFTKSILGDSAEERFNRLMKQSPHVLQMIPQKHLASYLGMTPETFSRMRKKTMK